MEPHVDHLSRDRGVSGNFEFSRLDKGHQFIASHPTHGIDFVHIGLRSWRAFHRGGEAHHDRAREWPRLSCEIADVFDVEVCFFFCFANDSVLGGFSRFHESGDERHECGCPRPVVPKKNPVFFIGNQNDHRRILARVFQTITLHASLSLSPVFAAHLPATA